MEHMAKTLHQVASARSALLFERGKRVFPDGTTRVTVERDPNPLYIARGEGAYLVDVDGNRLLDLNNNFTTLIHGHGFQPVVRAVGTLLKSGTCFANPTEHEIALAELLTQRIPTIESIRFVNSGSEAVMFAIKAARAFTGKPAIARIEGAFHGAYDWAETGQSGTPDTWGAPDNPRPVALYKGVPESVANDVIVLRFNDIEAAERRITAAAEKLSCIIIDPMPSRAGLIAARTGFFDALATLAKRHGILILADEVLNLRQGYRGASARYGIVPDLMAMGKIIGGGFPIGAIGGRAEVMQVFSIANGKPALPQGGTFSANPVSMVAGRVAMEAMTEGAFARLEIMGVRLRSELDAVIGRFDAPFSVTGAASLFRIHPKGRPPQDFRDAYADRAETAVMDRMCRHFRESGIVLPKGAAACLSTAMVDEDINKIIAAFASFLETLAPKGMGKPNE